MNHFARTITLITYITILFTTTACNAQAVQLKNSKPNIVIFLTDDQGWGDAGIQGHPKIKTPHFDKFSSQGVRFTNCYAACSVCSPSRAAILTGRTPYRNGVWRWIPSGSQYHLRTSEITLPSLLKQKGYTTAHVGKWHLNGKFNSDEQPQPDDHGYDYWFATQNNAAPSHKNPRNFVRNGKDVGPLEGFSAVLVAKEAQHWLTKVRDKSKPFFITVWTHEPHLPIESDPKYMSLYNDIDDPNIRQHHGNITQMDEAFGIVLKTLKDINAEDDTLVIFTSDNGPEGRGNNGRTRGSTGGLRGRKRATFEGGIRVPGAMRWPKVFKDFELKPGLTSDTPIIGSDFFPTICDIVGIPLPDDRTIDGASLLPLLVDEPVQRKQPLYWRNHLSPKSHNVAIRVGDWKIIANDDLSKFELYNLKEDWQETTDVSKQHPQIFEQLKTKLIATDKHVLEEGPDWWKNDRPNRPRQNRNPTNPAKLNKGTDKTNTFDITLGGEVTKHPTGYALNASQGETVTLNKLKTPLTGKVTLKGTYQSLVNANTKNAAIVIGDATDRNRLIKIGSAIGMNAHVIFNGDWNNVGNLAKTNAKFDPKQSFNYQITIDLNKQTINAKLPKDFKQIQYLGYYAKGTSSAFSKINVE